MRTLATGFAVALILSFLALSVTSHADRPPATIAFGPDTDRTQTDDSRNFDRDQKNRDPFDKRERSEH